MVDVEGDVMKVWQKDASDMFDYYFEFVADPECEYVDLKVGEQYYISKLIEMYYGDQMDYSTTAKYCFPVSRETKFKIQQYFENPKIKYLFE